MNEAWMCLAMLRECSALIFLWQTVFDGAVVAKTAFHFVKAG